MINLKTRSTKAERCAENGNICNIFGSLVAPILGGIAGKVLNDSGANTSETTAEKLPTLAPWQEPYVTGPAHVNQRSPMNAEAVNYNTSLSAGYNPAYGPQQPMSLAEIMGQARGGLGEAPTGPNYSQDPSATPREGGLRALLGYDRGAPPALFQNDPRLGNRVGDPQNLHGYGDGSGTVSAPGQGNVPLGEGQGQGGARGKIVRAPGPGMRFGVDVGGRVLDIEQAMPLVKAGLISIDGGMGDMQQAYVLSNTTDVSG